MLGIFGPAMERIWPALRFQVRLPPAGSRRTSLQEFQFLPEPRTSFRTMRRTAAMQLIQISSPAQELTLPRCTLSQMRQLAETGCTFMAAAVDSQPIHMRQQTIGSTSSLFLEQLTEFPGRLPEPRL